MSGISKNKRTQIFCFKSDEKKIEIYFLFNVFKIKKKNFVHIFEMYMKDPESAEINEKSNLRFCNYYFWELLSFLYSK